MTWVWDPQPSLLAQINRKLRALQEYLSGLATRIDTLEDTADDLTAGFTTIRDSGTLADDASYTYDPGTATVVTGRVTVTGVYNTNVPIGGTFVFDDAATQVESDSEGGSITDDANTDGLLCCFWSAGDLLIRNRLGFALSYIIQIDVLTS